MSFDWFDSRNWTSTQGRIIESDVQGIEAPRYKRGGRKYPNVIRFLPNIKYEYRVNAETFQSMEIYLAHDSLISDFESADALVGQYPLKKKIVVYYHPKKPERSFLEKKDYRVIVGNLVMGLLWLFFGFGILMQELSK